MDHSPVSERRANLLRQMARHQDHDRMSNASSGGSDRESQRDFDTESQILPALPAITPNNPAPRNREPEYQINTSALRRAFPDFSQYGSSEDDSMEIGRGLRTNNFQSAGRILPSEDPSENMSLNLGGERFTVTGTPPIRPKTHTAQVSGNAKAQAAPGFRRTTSEKGNADPHPLAKTTDYVSSQSSRDCHGKRQALRELQASVESDDSISVTGERPKPTSKSTKNTRFNSTRTRQPLAEALNAPNAQGSYKADNGTVNSVTDMANGTFQSFALPDLPNITELVSGQRVDGTPLFSKSAKSHSRFATASSLRKAKNGKSGHASIDNVAVPADAKALYVSLQILQEKYALLEQEKAQAVEKADSYELECLQLKSTVETQGHQHRVQHSDSGVDVNDDDGRTRERETGRSQFEASIKSLQSRLNRANKKVTESEATIQHLTKDRDAAHQQLALAFVNSEELKNEGQAVRGEIEEVKAQLMKVTRQHEKRIEKLMRQETELRSKIERREKAVKEMASLANELWESRKVLAKACDTEHEAHKTTERPSRSADLQRSSVGSHSISQPKTTRGGPYNTSFDTTAAWTGISGQRQRSNSRHSVPRVEQDDLRDKDETDHMGFDLDNPELRINDLTKDDAYLSFMEGDEIAKLRRIVEQDKARLAQAGVNINALLSHETLSGAANAARTSARPRKSSLKSLGGQPKKHSEAGILDEGTQDVTTDALNENRTQVGSLVGHTRNTLTRDNKNTRQSFFSQRSEARRRSAGAIAEDMTSALIVPDITLAGKGFEPSDNKHTAKIHRPVPVSDRIVEPTIDNEDPTLRPAQSPAVALATVLQSLEDEIEHLRQQLGKYEKMYNQHDPALSRRKRKAVYERMQKLLAAIETRSDQVYTLYDVLEGQKQSGQMMDESEVEVTLRDLGIDVAPEPESRCRSGTLGNAACEKQNKKKVTINDDRSDSGSESDLPFEVPSDDEHFETYEDHSLPWEGIEATQTHTLGSLRSSGAPAASLGAR